MSTHEIHPFIPYIAAILFKCEEVDIKQVLKNQVECWNSGDLECYMEGYWRSDQLMFVGKKGVTYGWESTLSMYQKSYPSKEKMGFLEMDIKDIYPLSEDYWFVIGQWKLTRSGDTPQGYFSLLFRMIDGEWKVVVDHSS
ncbi:MAG: DUF4440 domain-containing protein [Flammeovirgaceae bacterium]|nr:DUF4440 domain-containing protein [Flammeovirgaceae bacterium]MBE62399.1 DUF4440 domain-containing protein [Flammeovirgaceae bacterium]MBR10779.1 DUF4440 domain-containing protein [Rickettsiales bacterium]HCX23039.1 DUF4440 domain-containing protein [Cytophagales bacterium]